MTKDDVGFEDWFDFLKMNLEPLGVQFNDKDSVRSDYEEGRDMFDVLDEIKAEYE